jgi:ankyrin repeat protein
MSEFLKCECSHCGQPIEFPSEGIGQIVPCPTCKKTFTLASESIRMLKSNCSQCFGGIEFSENGYGCKVSCPHCGQKTELGLNLFLDLKPFGMSSGTKKEIRFCKCEPAPTVIPPSPPSRKRTPGVPLRKLTEETIKVRTKTGDTPLHRAAKTGRISEIPRHLLGTELFMVKNNDGQTPIHLAARFGQFDKVPPDFLTKETMAGILHYLAIYGHADQIPKEFLKPEFLSIYESGHETVLHALVRADRLELVPEIYANSEMWNLKDSSGRTARDLHQIYLEWKTIKEKVRAEPATEKQREKLRYFGYAFDKNISKGQASDALDKCVRDFPEINQAYYNRPATEEQLAKLREINEQGQDSDEESPDLEEKVFMTYGYAKKLIQDWELSNRVFERQQIIASDLTDCEDSYWEKHHWDDDYEESERGRFDQVCYEILDGWQFDKFGELPTRKQVAKAWELVKSRKPNKSEFPTHIELVNTLPELFPEFKRR